MNPTAINGLTIAGNEIHINIGTVEEWTTSFDRMPAAVKAET